MARKNEDENFKVKKDKAPEDTKGKEMDDLQTIQIVDKEAQDEIQENE